MCDREALNLVCFLRDTQIAGKKEKKKWYV